MTNWLLIRLAACESHKPQTLHAQLGSEAISQWAVCKRQSIVERCALSNGFSVALSEFALVGFPLVPGGYSVTLFMCPIR